MNSAMRNAASGEHWLDRIGIPKHLAFGFLGLLLFMIGDGVEAGYLTPFITSMHLPLSSAALMFTMYGVTVCISSWLSGALSDIFGPKRVMWVGLAIWAFFEVIFLVFGAAKGNYEVMLIAYTLRGFGYPLFAFGFLVWIAAATPSSRLGSAVGWFWFAFAGGLPTLGSLFASITIPLIGQMATFWCSLGLVVTGGLITLIGTRDHRGLQRAEGASENPLKVAFGSISIMWQEPRVAMGGIVRMINTSSEYAFLVIMPGFFTQVIGFSLTEWLQLLSVMFISNTVCSLLAGIGADRYGYRRVIGFLGGIGSAISVPLFFYMPQFFKDNFAVAAVFGIFYGLTLGSFTPMSALMPLLTPRRKAAALSILGLGAGASTWFGPGIVSIFEGSVGIKGVIWIFSGLYVVSAILTRFLVMAPESERKAAEAKSQSGAVLAH